MTKREFYGRPLGLYLDRSEAIRTIRRLLHDRSTILLISYNYNVTWKDNPELKSLASLGVNIDGSLRLDPCNWLSPSNDTHKIWKKINKLKLIYGLRRLRDKEGFF